MIFIFVCLVLYLPIKILIESAKKTKWHQGLITSPFFIAWNFWRMTTRGHTHEKPDGHPATDARQDQPADFRPPENFSAWSWFDTRLRRSAAAPEFYAGMMAAPAGMIPNTSKTFQAWIVAKNFHGENIERKNRNGSSKTWRLFVTIRAAEHTLDKNIIVYVRLAKLISR